MIAFAGWVVFLILILIAVIAFGISALVNRAEPGTGVSEQLRASYLRVRKSLGMGGRASSGRDEATKADLYEQAKEAGIPGRSTMTKDELKAALDEQADGAGS